jgi:hypothetical protein
LFPRFVSLPYSVWFNSCTASICWFSPLAGFLLPYKKTYMRRHKVTSAVGMVFQFWKEIGFYL